MSKLIKILLFFCVAIQAQNNSEIYINATNNNRIYNIEQQITFVNNSNIALNKIYLNNWLNAFSSKSSDLSNKFSDEFNRNYSYAPMSDIGYSNIEKIFINNEETTYTHPNEKTDLVEIFLKSNLNPSEKLTIKINYQIKIPLAKFTKFGYFSENKIVLKNCFINLCAFKNDEFILHTEKNLDDLTNNFTDFKVNFINLNNYAVNTDLNEVNKNDSIYYEGKNLKNFTLFLEKKATITSFKNSYTEVLTNLTARKTDDYIKATIINKITKFTKENLGETNQNKILVTQDEYEREPFYGLNELPDFIAPFPNEFLFEIKFLKTYLNNFLYQNLNINFRDDHWVLNGIQHYLIKKYLNENYPKIKAFGKISEYKILKGYKMFDMEFTEQFLYNYLLMLRGNLDQSLILPKDELIKFNDKIAGKFKAALYLEYINKYSNNNAVDKALMPFLILNKTKSTTPNDFINLISNLAEKPNTKQYLNELINNNNPIDFIIKKVQKLPNEINICLKNKNNNNLPIILQTIKNNSIVNEQWLPAFTDTLSVKIKKGDFDKVAINYQAEIPEFNLNNNSYNLNRKFLLYRPLKIKFFKDFEDPNYNQIFFVPTLSYNLYDGALIGLNVNNNTIINKLFNYDFLPSYSTLTQKLVGSANFAYTKNYFNTSLFSTKFALGGTTLHYAPDALYTKLTPSVTFRFRNTDLRKNEGQNITFRQVFINREQSKFLGDFKIRNYTVFNARYSYGKTELAEQFSYSTDFQISNSFNKITGSVSYRKLFNNNRYFTIRGFVGTFLYNDNPNFYQFGLEKPVDLLFDTSLIGRSESTGIFSQQYVYAEGGFKSKLPTRLANEYMLTINSTFNIWNWIEVYGDIGTLKNKGQNAVYVYDTGLHLNLVQDYFQLFLPVYSSNGYELNQNRYQDKIRFVLTISPNTLVSLFTRRWF